MAKICLWYVAKKKLRYLHLSMILHGSVRTILISICSVPLVLVLIYSKWRIPTTRTWMWSLIHCNFRYWTRWTLLQLLEILCKEMPFGYAKVRFRVVRLDHFHHYKIITYHHLSVHLTTIIVCTRKTTYLLLYQVKLHMYQPKEPVRECRLLDLFVNVEFNYQIFSLTLVRDFSVFGLTYTNWYNLRKIMSIIG